ncbi:methyltransferase-like protein 27 isoform X5 [Haliotis rufescens]|uniref:methyltransferase-like protein 27 isoform X5 n=1 Tax=Haliotis rufescens TaxID=6454 RepID=UPI00201ECC0D|nr:methyltransferase-like protein 27 isoform X5 [Haliotis rufescens]
MHTNSTFTNSGSSTTSAVVPPLRVGISHKAISTTPLVRTFSVYRPSSSSPVFVCYYLSRQARTKSATRILNAQGPKELAITTVERFPSNRENVRILDIAAGTGMCAEQLRKQGFKKIDALDGSEGMLEIAREKGLYDRYTLGELGDNTLDAATDTYDAITICALNESVMKRLPIKAYEEIIRVVKKGGYIIWVSHYRVFTDADPEREDMIRHVTSLEAKGKWKRVELRFVSSSIFSEEVTVVFQSTRSASFSAALICIHVLSVLWQY